MLTFEQMCELKAGDNITVDITHKDRKRRVYRQYVVLAVNQPADPGRVKIASTQSSKIVYLYDLTDPRLSI